MAVRDGEAHGLVAAKGFASLRVDLRGTGNSSGPKSPMLAPAERQDLIAATNWIKQQPWSNGKVVLMGMSWSAICALLALSENPKMFSGAVLISCYGDAYTDGLNFLGGCLTNEVAGWNGAVNSYATRMPDPKYAGLSWAQWWRTRLDTFRAEHLHTFQNQENSVFWHDRRVQDLSNVRCPILMVSGLNDPKFTASTVRMLQRFGGRVTAVIGPWAHRWPHLPVPKPGVATPQLITEWLEKELGGSTNTLGVSCGKSTVWIDESRTEDAYFEHSTGRWVELEHKELTKNWMTTFELCSDGEKNRDRQSDHAIIPPTPAYHSAPTGELMPAFNAGPGPEFAGDQRHLKGNSFRRELEIGATDCVIIGEPVVTWRVKTDQPVSKLIAILSERRPNGSLARIALGAVNLANLAGTSCESGFQTISIPLSFLSYRMRAHGTLCLDLTNEYWPMFWPSPVPTQTTIDLATSYLDLPIRQGAPIHVERTGIDVVSNIESDTSRKTLRAPFRKWRLPGDDESRAASTLSFFDSFGVHETSGSGLRIGSAMSETYRVDPNNNAIAEVNWWWSFKSQGQSFGTFTKTCISSDQDEFKTSLTVRLRDGGTTREHVAEERSFLRDQF